MSASKRKRKRDSDNSDAEPENNFYLKHQNSALASELYGYKKDIDDLRKEREWRRNELEEVRKVVDSVEGAWRGGIAGFVAFMYRVLGEPFEFLEKQQKSIINSSSTNDSLPPSTGKGTDVETVPPLFSALYHLAQSLDPSQSPSQSLNGNLPSSPISAVTKDLSKSSQTLSKKFHDFISILSEKNQSLAVDIIDISKLHSRISSMESQLRAHDNERELLGSSRDESLRNEKKIRTCLYRIAAGRYTIEDAMKNIEKDDSDFVTMDCPASIVSSSAISAEVVSSSSSSDQPVVSSPEMLGPDKDNNSEMCKKLQELEAVAECRTDKINELLQEREDQSKRINSLIVAQTNNEKRDITPDELKKTDTYLSTAAKLLTVEGYTGVLKKSLQSLQDKYTTTLADLRNAHKTVDDLNDKHAKRWNELTYASEETSELEENIITLEHKLHQALETSRHAESLQKALAEAQKINEPLQEKVSELKSKYAAVTAAKASRHAESSSKNSSSSSHSSSSSLRNDAHYDRLKADFRKVRKELMSANISKENYKSKLERSEKERESLSRGNSRLLKLSTEKEEMNAKSLSEILHLQDISKLHEKEKAALEKKAKSAQQLALTARMTANAKKRVEEEAFQLVKLAEERELLTQTSLQKLQEGKDRQSLQLEKSQSHIDSLKSSILQTKLRFDELSQETTTIENEKLKLREQLVSSKCSLEKKIEGSIVKGGNFTVDQLETHLTVLKRRLACPVCNDREKSVILLRCRHMFCKHCVDENIKNRSRKCPACAQRFDMKDVGDIWL